MGRYRKCAICGEAILPTDVAVPYKKRYVHDRCFNLEVKILTKNKTETLAEKEKERKSKKSKAKTKTELKDGMTEEEYVIKRKYFNYLKSLTDLTDDESLSVKQVAVTEMYIDRYNFTYEGMYDTLVYLNEIIHKDLTGDIVGIIPFYYSEAMKFQDELNEIEQKSKSFSFRGKYKTKVVKTNKAHTRKNYQPMDVLSVGE